MIIVKNLLIALVMFVFLNCSAQSQYSECSSEIQFEKTTKKAKKDGYVSDKDLEAVAIRFINTFNNKVKGYVGDSLRFDKVVTTDDVRGMTDDYFGFNYEGKSLSELPVIRIEVEDVGCIELEIIKKYKMIYLFLEGNNLTARYSNTLYVEN